MVTSTALRSSLAILAALRMARFWTERIDLYGDAAFNITSNISLPTEDDLLRMYNRSYDVVECRDPAVREENRAMARAFQPRQQIQHFVFRKEIQQSLRHE